MDIFQLLPEASPVAFAAFCVAGFFVAGWRLRRARMPLAAKIDAVLPQTQCGQCGYAGCRPYADAIAIGAVPINRCPPGGERVIRKLARLAHRPALRLDQSRGAHKPPLLARIDEQRCIGCTLCIRACPVDAIVGAAKLVHTVIADHCTGCELCLPPCPVDCIELVPAPWQFSELVPGHRRRAADAARTRFERRRQRLERMPTAHTAHLAAKAGAKHAAAAPESDAALERKRAIVAAAVARARARLAASR